MQNPNKWFRDGMGRLQTSLQGVFTDAFRSVVAEAVKKCTEEEWVSCIDLLIKETKKTMDFTVGDFLQALSAVRSAKAVEGSRWELRPPAKGSPDWKKLAETIESDPGAPPASKEIAQFLAGRKRQKTAQEPVRRGGGEKYRTDPS